MNINPDKFIEYSNQILVTNKYGTKYETRIFDAFVLMTLFLIMHFANFNILMFPLYGLVYLLTMSVVAKLLAWSSSYLEEKLAQEAGMPARSVSSTKETKTKSSKDSDTLH